MSGSVTIGRRRRWAWRASLGTAVLVVAAALLVGPYQFLLGNVAGSTAGPARPAPCLPGEPVEIMDSPHISEADAESVEYNSLPPTSGPHYLAPYPALEGGIALTAWGHIDLLDGYHEQRITEFVEGLRGRYNHGWTTADDC